MLGDGVVVDGRFAIKGLLGIGGTSAVYVAEQTSMGRDVALKVLRSELITHEQATDRFVREVRAISRLTSPHTVSVYDVGRTPEGLLFIAMELLRGRSLFQVMSDEPGPMALWRAVNVVDQVLESLAEAHASGVLHRDLKPENIFIVESATSKEFSKVLDFGIAQLGDETDLNAHPRGMVVGTPRYMSPEQMTGQPLDARSDLYSLATVLFELLSGRPPFEAPSPLALAVKKTTEKAPRVRQANPAARVPDEIEIFMERNLSPLLGDRCATATEFRNLLAMAVEGHLPDPSTRMATEPPQRTHTTRYPPRPAPPPPPPPPAPTRPTDRRQHARSAQMKNVVFRLDGVEHKATTTDLSPGGAFLACRALPPIGTRIEVYSTGTSRESGLARGVGEVVRVVQAAGAPSAVRGFALRWVPSDSAPTASDSRDKTPVSK